MSPRPREEQILAVAERLIYERGYATVSVDEIGAAVGISGPAIYKHFSGKDEIIGTLFDRALDALITSVAQDFADPVEELRFLIHAHTRFVLDHEALATIVVRDAHLLPVSHRRRHERRERAYFDRWIDCVHACFAERSRQECTAAAHAMLQMLSSVGMWPRAAREAQMLETLMPELARGALSELAGVKRDAIAQLLAEPHERPIARLVAK